MKPYRITAELLSPLLIQRKRQSSAPPTLNYLPGGTLRGAVAAKLLREGVSPDDPVFVDLFLSDPVPFPDLLPAPDADTRMGPLPASMVSCKRQPGFRSSGHGAICSLPAIAAGRLGKPVDTGAVVWKCPECGEDMKPFSGFWNLSKSAPAKFEPTLITRRHTGIDRTTGTLAIGAFFMTQSMADHYKTSKGNSDAYLPQRLTGRAWMTDSQAEQLEACLEGTLFVGAERTRGMGEIRLFMTEDAIQPPDIHQWNAAFRKRFGALTGQEPAMEGILFSILLESHAIALDAFLRPTADLAAMIAGDALDPATLRPVARIATAETIRGWQTAWNLAKPDDVAVGRGGVYLYLYTGDDPAALDDRLRALTGSGIGVRGEEGFGAISFCNDLHIMEEVI